MKKKQRNGQHQAWMVDQVFQPDPPSKRLLEVCRSSLVFAGIVYVVLLVIGLLASIGSWNGSSFLEAQLFLVPFCCGVADEWGSFLPHLFAVAKRAGIHVELKTEERRDVSQVPSWW